MVALKLKAGASAAVVGTSSVLSYMAIAPSTRGEYIGNFVYNVSSKDDIEAAEKDINDLGVLFDNAEPADMYKAGAYILREALERAYKSTQKLNEEEIRKYSTQYGTYANRDPNAETDVFLPIKSRENYNNNANAPTLDISNTLATYNTSLCNIPPSKSGFLGDLKSKVFDTNLYKEMYHYRSTLKSREVTKTIIKDKKPVTIKYKEFWTESELDPFDDTILLASFFEKSPYYQLERNIYQKREYDPNKPSQAKAEKDWEKFKNEAKRKLAVQTRESSGRSLSDNEELTSQREEQLKKNFMAGEFLKFVKEQPYFGSHKEYVYKDNTTGTGESSSLFGAMIKKYYYNGEYVQRFVRNNYYDTITVSPPDQGDKDGFFRRMKDGLTLFMKSNSERYGYTRMKRRKVGTELGYSSMDINPDGTVNEKKRKKESSLQKDFGFSDHEILKRTDNRKFVDWANRDKTTSFTDNQRAGSLTHGDNSATAGVGATYEDMKRKYPEAMEIHERLVKLLKSKKMYEVETKKGDKEGKEKANKEKDSNKPKKRPQKLGFGTGLKFEGNDDSEVSLTDWIRKREQSTLYETYVKDKDSKKSKKTKVTFPYLTGKDREIAIKDNIKAYREFLKKLKEQEKKHNDVQNSNQVDASSSDGGVIIQEAAKYLGGKYVWGGNSLSNGVDCSGFTKAIYSKFGKNIPRSSKEQRNAGTKVNSLKDAKPGDLLCFNGHVGIYAGNNEMIHAADSRHGIIRSKINWGRNSESGIVAIRRIVDNFNLPSNNTQSKSPSNTTLATGLKTAGQRAITAGDINKILKNGNCRNMGSFILNTSIKYGQDPAFMTSIIMVESGGSPNANHKNNPMSLLKKGHYKYPTMEAGIEAGIKNIATSSYYKKCKNITEFGGIYCVPPGPWVRSIGKVYKQITGNDISTMKFNGGTDPSTPDNSQSASITGAKAPNYDPDLDGRGMSMDVNFPLVEKHSKYKDKYGKEKYLSSDEVYVPITIDQKIAMFQTYMYNTIEPSPKRSTTKDTNFDDADYDESKIDRKKYVYAKELEDVIWGSFRQEQKKFLFIFSYNKTINVENEGLDLDIENKVATGSELRAFGDSSGGSNSSIVQAAIKHLGETGEKTWQWFGMTDEWCCMFVSKCAFEANVPKSIWEKDASTVSSLQRAMKKQFKKDPATYTPKPGDIVWFKGNRNAAITNHIGIVEKVEGDKVHTIEGNSGSGGLYERKVIRHSYNKSDRYIVAYQSTAGSDISSAFTDNSNSSTENQEIQGILDSNAQVECSSTGQSGASDTPNRYKQFGGNSHKNIETAFTEDDVLDNKGASMHSISGYFEGSDDDKIYKFLRSRGYSPTSASAIIGSIVSLKTAKFSKDKVEVDSKFVTNLNSEQKKKINSEREKIDKQIEKLSKEKEKSDTKIEIKTQKKLEDLDKKKMDLMKKYGKEHGIFKWKNERWVDDRFGLYNFAKRTGRDWDSIEAQIAFMDWEMTHWASKNFGDCPKMDYDEKVAMGIVKKKSDSDRKKDKKLQEKIRKHKKEINPKYANDETSLNPLARKDKNWKDYISGGQGRLIQTRRNAAHLRDKIAWSGSLDEFKIFDEEHLDDAVSVFINCYVDPSGEKDSLVNDAISNARKIYSQYYENRELNRDSKHKDYIAFRGSNHNIAKESYLLLKDNIVSVDENGDGNAGIEGAIYMFKGAICSSFSPSDGDTSFGFGKIQGGKNVVAAHNMPYGTIVHIPELKGRMGGGKFTANNGKTYDLGEINNGNFIVADTGGPFFDFDIWMWDGSSKKNMDVAVLKWGDGPMAWTMTQAIEHKGGIGVVGSRGAFTQCFTKYGGFKTTKLTKFSSQDANNPALNR